MTMKASRLTFLVVLAVPLLLGGVSHAEDLGTYGRAYSIKERDAIDAMKEAAAKKLANGGKEEMLKGAKDRYLASLENIVLPETISQASSNAVRMVDLTEINKEDIRDEQGNVIVPKGFSINPLKIMPLTKKLFFIDQRDAKQVAWTKANAKENDKIIVMAGSVMKAGQTLKRRVYMDVPGLHTKMKIFKVPSVVSQQDSMLRVQEVKL
jgi:conjugal transfer pilus assembly protein TraW